MSYKSCLLRICKSTTIKTPEKIFVCIPREASARKMWLQWAGRDEKKLSSTSSLYLCEDHFEMEKVVANYQQYKMGFSNKVIVTKGAMPTKPADRKTRLGGAVTARKGLKKRQKIKVPQSDEELEIGDQVQSQNDDDARNTNRVKKVSRLRKKVNYRSKAVQTTRINTNDMCTTSSDIFNYASITDKPQTSTADGALSDKKRIDDTSNSDSLTLEVRKVIMNVYHFLKKEFDLTKRDHDPKCDLSHLTDIIRRTANATGYNENTVTKILREEQEKNMLDNVQPNFNSFQVEIIKEESVDNDLDTENPTSEQKEDFFHSVTIKEEIGVVENDLKLKTPKIEPNEWDSSSFSIKIEIEAHSD